MYIELMSTLDNLSLRVRTINVSSILLVEVSSSMFRITSLGFNICMYVCIYVCTFVCMYVSTCVLIFYVCIYVLIYVYMYLPMYICINEYVFI